jgi:hypothetical protein
LNDDELRVLAARLDYIERYLTHLGQVAGYRYAPFGGGVPPDVVELARLGRTNEAIKLYRKLTDANLEQAKAVIDQVTSGGTGQQFAGAGQPAAGSPGYGGEFAPFDAAPDSFGGQASFSGDAGPPLGPAGLAGSPLPGASIGGVPADIVALARAGMLIDAVKQYRNMTGMPLKAAKDAVEQAVRGY